MTDELTTRTPRRLAATNLAAQAGALICVSVASLLVARAGGAAVLGDYALLRVLPWLVGVILSCGLPTASAYFLASSRRHDRRMRPTLSAMAVAGAALGALLWLGISIPLRDLFFKTTPTHLVAIMAAVVVTQLFTVTAKACCQGSGDMRGANLIIVAEEFWFVPVYVVVLHLYGKGISAVVISLLLSGGLATATGVIRLARQGFFRGWGMPSHGLAREVAAYGARGQLGNLLWLMNLRFDFLLLGAIAGPTVLGIYAVASKFAELMRLVPTAINYVLYPRFARLGEKHALPDARHLLPRATALTVVLTPVLAVASAIALPILYGSQFRGAVLPAEIILIGLSVEGAAAVTSAFLLGIRRPGLNSWGMAAGVVITASMDLVLIPRYGARGGAITSAVAYLTTTCVLYVIFRGQARRIESQDDRREADNELALAPNGAATDPEPLVPAELIRRPANGRAPVTLVGDGNSLAQYSARRPVANAPRSGHPSIAVTTPRRLSDRSSMNRHPATRGAHPTSARSGDDASATPRPAATSHQPAGELPGIGPGPAGQMVKEGDIR